MVCRMIHRNDHDLIFHLFVLLPGSLNMDYFHLLEGTEDTCIFIVISNSVISLVKS